MSDSEHGSGFGGVIEGLTSTAGATMLGVSLGAAVIVGLATAFLGLNSQTSINLALATLVLVYGIWIAESLRELDTDEMGLVTIYGAPSRFIDSGQNLIVAGIEEVKVTFKSEFELNFVAAGVYSMRNARLLVDIDRLTNKVIETNRLFPSEPTEIVTILKMRFLRTMDGLSKLATNGPPEIFSEGISFERVTEILTDKAEEIVLSELRVLAKGFDYDQLVNERVHIAKSLRIALAHENSTFQNYGVDMSSLRLELKHVDPPESVKKAMADEAIAESTSRAEAVLAEGEKIKRVRNAEARREEIRIAAEAYGVDPSEVPYLEAAKAAGESGKGVFIGSGIQDAFGSLFRGRAARIPPKPRRPKKP